MKAIPRLLAPAVLAFASAAALAQAPGVSAGAAAAPRLLPGIEAQLKTADAWAIKGTYLPAQPGERTFVLLHGSGMRRQVWRTLAARLQRAGLGYLAIDLRGHGESAVGPDGKPANWRGFKVTKTENEFANMTLDVSAAFSYLSGQGVSEEGAGLIGIEVGGSLALKYAAVHPKVPMVVMLSPGMSYQEILTVNAMRAYKDRPILMIYSELERGSAKATPLLYEIARRSAGERNATLISVGDRRGARMLTGALAQRIVEWLQNPVKPEAPAPSTSTLFAPAAESSGAVDAEDSGAEP